MTADTLIHVGYHKTGTTWLQKEVFCRTSSVFQPLVPMGTPNTHLNRTFFQDADGKLLSPYVTNEAVSRAWLDAFYAANPTKGRVPVLSSERLSGNPHAAGFDAPTIARRLQRVFPRAQILICIREQRSWLLSNYIQYLKAGGTMPLHRYLHERYDGRRPGFSLSFIDYLPLVTDYRELFGADRVMVLPYELFKRDKATFLKRIGEPLGVTIPISSDRYDAQVHATRDEFLWYRLRALNPMRYPSSLNNFSSRVSPRLRGLVDRGLRAAGAWVPARVNDATRQRLAAEIDAVVGDRYTSSNRALSDLIGEDLGHYGYHR